MWQMSQSDAPANVTSVTSPHFLEVRTRSELGSTPRSGPLRLGPRTCKYGSSPPSHRTEPRTCGFGSVRTLVRIGPDRTVDSVVGRLGFANLSTCMLKVAEPRWWVVGQEWRGSVLLMNTLVYGICIMIHTKSNLL